jgi:cell wall-associated NlpC family hydrolase
MRIILIAALLAVVFAYGVEHIQTESDAEAFGMLAGIYGAAAFKHGRQQIKRIHKVGNRIHKHANKLHREVKAEIAEVAAEVESDLAEIREMADSEAFSPASVAVAYARAQVGKGYSQQARLGPNSFDCSGLVLMAYKAAGKNVPTTTRGYPGGLMRVSGQPQAGDILWKSGHVGMYIGNGQIVHAANSRVGVEQRSFDYYKKYLGVTAIYRPY